MINSILAGACFPSLLICVHTYYFLPYLFTYNTLSLYNKKTYFCSFYILFLHTQFIHNVLSYYTAKQIFLNKLLYK